MSELDIRPCPFCGKKPRIKYPDVDGGCTLAHPVGCKFMGGQVWLFATPEDAVKAWNERKA